MARAAPRDDGDIVGSRAALQEHGLLSLVKPNGRVCLGQGPQGGGDQRARIVGKVLGFTNQ